MAAYGIDVINVREVVRGVNRTFSLCDSGDRTYYLRQYRTHGRGEGDIDSELRLLERIEQDEVLAVSVAHPTLEGACRFRVALSDGAMRHAALFYGAEGRPLEMTRDDLGVAAQALKRLHDQPSLKDYAPRRQIADIREARRTLNRLAERFTFAGSAVAAVRERCERLVAAGWPPAEMPFGFAMATIVWRTCGSMAPGSRCSTSTTADAGRNGSIWPPLDGGLKLTADAMRPFCGARSSVPTSRHCMDLRPSTMQSRF